MYKLNLYYLFYKKINIIKFLHVLIWGLAWLWCLTLLSTIWWRKTEYPEKTTKLPQVTDKTLSHNVASSTHRLSGIRTHNLFDQNFMKKVLTVIGNNSINNNKKKEQRPLTPYHWTQKDQVIWCWKSCSYLCTGTTIW